MSKKSKSQENIVFGRNLQRLRIERGILDQQTMADLLGWRQHCYRDRECAVAAITLFDVEQLAIAFRMSPVEMARALMRPIFLSQFDTFVYDFKEFDKQSEWVSLGGHIVLPKGQWNLVFRENKYKVFEATDDLDAGLEAYEEELSRIRDSVKHDNIVVSPYPDQVGEDEFKNKLKPNMRRHGRCLMGARVKRKYSSQWMFSTALDYNPSWVQKRESGKTVIKLEELVWIGRRWGESPLDIAEEILAPQAPTQEMLDSYRAKYR
jgi:hypothetical protein